MNKNTLFNDFLTDPQCEDFGGDWEEQQVILRASGYSLWVDEQENKYWEDLAKKSEGSPCNQ